MELNLRPIIEAGSSHSTIVQAKPGHPDDMERHLGGGTQASDVARVRWYLRFYKRDTDHRCAKTISITKRNDELRLKVVVSFCKAPWASEVCVRRWKVLAVTCWFELSLLCGLPGSALLRALLGATLFRCFLSTFFSCHSFYVLLLSRLCFSVSS